MIFKALLICIILLALASYLSYLRTGQFWIPAISMSNINLTMPSLPGNPFSSKSTAEQSALDQTGAESVSAPTTTTYKWLDNGRWNYGDTPPKGVKAELISKPAE